MPRHTRSQDRYGLYQIPAWLEPYLDLLGGRENVVRLMSGPRAVAIQDPMMAVAQERMGAQIDLIDRMRTAGTLK